MNKAEELFIQNQIESQRLIETLPSQYEYLTKIYTGKIPEEVN